MSTTNIAILVRPLWTKQLWFTQRHVIPVLIIMISRMMSAQLLKIH